MRRVVGYSGSNILPAKIRSTEELYYNSEFDEAIRTVRECLKISSIDKPQLIRAYTLLARIYLASDDKVAAENNITQILKLNPSYSPTIEEETPKYVNLVAVVRKNAGDTEITATEAPSDSSGISPWVWIGAGGAAVITIIAVVSSNNGKNSQTVQDKALPEPPGYPQ